MLEFDSTMAFDIEMPFNTIMSHFVPGKVLLGSLAVSIVTAGCVKQLLQSPGAAAISARQLLDKGADLGIAGVVTALWLNSSTCKIACGKKKT